MRSRSCAHAVKRSSAAVSAPARGIELGGRPALALCVFLAPLLAQSARQARQLRARGREQALELCSPLLVLRCDKGFELGPFGVERLLGRRERRRTVSSYAQQDEGDGEHDDGPSEFGRLLRAARQQGRRDGHGLAVVELEQADMLRTCPSRSRTGVESRRWARLSSAANIAAATATRVIVSAAAA